jgi:hypothetical protein
MVAISLAYPSGEDGGNLLVQVISTCCHGFRGRGREVVGTLWTVRTLLVEGASLLCDVECGFPESLQASSIRSRQYRPYLQYSKLFTAWPTVV